MTDNLFTFQQRAVNDLRQKVMLALSGYRLSHTPQVVSFTAPTGSGKTIIMSALIEDIFYGTEQILNNLTRYLYGFRILLNLMISPEIK